jgi:opacity protein-like surface antigen
MRRFLSILSLAILSAISADAQEEEETREFRTVPWTIWGGAGTDFDSYSLAIGIRRGAFGLGFGYRRDTEITVPEFDDAEATGPTFGETSFAVNALGLDLYTAYGIADFADAYASVGGYVDVNTVLERDTVTQRWHRSPSSPDWTNARMEFGGGLEFNPIEWMVVGIGYHGVRGFNLHVGYRW